MRRRAAGAVLAAILAAGSAAASCADPAAPPALTLVDRLFDADAVAMATADPADPARWRLVEAPAPVSVSMDAPDPGAYLAAGADGPPPALGEGEVVVFAHDPVDAVWRRLGVFDRVVRPAVEGFLEAARGWEDPRDPARFQRAARLLDSPDPALRTLGLQELDAAPYETLRGLRLPLDVAALIESLNAPRSEPLEPIHALLLGLTGAPLARALIEDRIGAPGAGAPARCAWAVALVEIDGAPGVTTLEARFLRADPAVWPADRLAPMIEALAIQAGAASPEIRARILEALTGALDARPDLAAPVTRSFSARADWALGPAVQAALKRRAGLPAADALIAASYVFAARKAAQSGEAGVDGAAWGAD